MTEAYPVILPQLWPYQQTFVDDPVQFAVCKAATKTGKTTAEAWWLAREAMRYPGELFWWIGPTNEVGLIGYKTVLHLLGPILRKKSPKRERPWKFYTQQGSCIALKTAQEPEYLRGAGPKSLVIDEAGSPDYEKAWPEIRTTISATRGRGRIGGNPGEAGQFLDRAEMWGKDPLMPEWSYVFWKYLDRPTAMESDLEQLKRELGEDSHEFRRYYLGETIQGHGAFFYNLDTVFTAEPEEPKPGEDYIIGVDTARKSDYFVASVFHERTHRQVAYSRYKGPPSEQQEDEIERMAKLYNDALICIEINDAGGPISQSLQTRGLRVRQFHTNLRSKPTTLYEYRSDLSHGALTLLDDEYQKKEHMNYRVHTTALGTVRLGSPYGGNDDMVMANAFANNALRRVTSAELTWVC